MGLGTDANGHFSHSDKKLYKYEKTYCEDTQIQSFIMWMVTLTRPMKKMNAGRRKPGMPGRSAWTGVRKIVISFHR